MYSNTDDVEKQMKFIEENTKRELMESRDSIYKKIREMREAADRRKLVMLVFRSKNARWSKFGLILPNMSSKPKKREIKRFVIRLNLNLSVNTIANNLSRIS